MNYLLYIGALVLAFVSIITVLVILMQRPSANAGMGASLGGGAAESAFGGEAVNVLTKMTNIFIIIFLVLSLGLFLGFKHSKPINETPSAKGDSLIKDLSKTETPATPSIAPAVEKKPDAPAVPAKPAGTETPVLKDLQPMPTTPAAPAATTPAK